jgi:transcriptional regulator with XRE-family HTH domain
MDLPFGGRGIRLEIRRSMSTAILKEIGANLKAARKRAGLRQLDLETKFGITYRHYQNIEAGRINMSVLTLCRLAKILDTTVSDLTRGHC